MYYSSLTFAVVRWGKIMGMLRKAQLGSHNKGD